MIDSLIKNQGKETGQVAVYKICYPSLKERAWILEHKAGQINKRTHREIVHKKYVLVSLNLGIQFSEASGLKGVELSKSYVRLDAPRGVGIILAPRGYDYSHHL